MADTIEYVFKITDKGSQALQRIGMDADSATSKVRHLQEESMELSHKIAGGNRSIINPIAIHSVEKTTAKVRELGMEIKKTDRTGKDSGENWFSNAMSQIPFAGLLANPLVLAGAAVGNAFRVGIQDELTNTSFKVLLNSQEAAEKMIADITQYGAQTPYDQMGLGENVKTMLSFGLEADSIMPNLQAIGDVAMGDADKMKSLTLAFSQMSSTGKLTGQDLMQMVNAGFNPLEEISRVTHKSLGELKEEMAKGQISAEMVSQAFFSATSQGGKFHGMAKAMGETLGGKVAQLMDNISASFLILYKVIKPLAMKMVEFANVLTSGIISGIGGFIEKVKQANFYVVTFLGVIGSVSTALGIMKLATMAQATWSAALTLATNLSTAAWWANNAAMFANPVTWIIAGIVALIAAIGFLIYKVDGWGQAWKNTLEAVKYLWSGYMSFLKFGWLKIEDILLSGIDKIKIGWYSLKKIWDAQGANEGLKQIHAQSEARKKLIEQQGSKVRDSTLKAWDYTKKAAGSFSVNNKGFFGSKNSVGSKAGISAPSTTPGALDKNADKNADKNKENSSGIGSKINNSIGMGSGKSNYTTINVKNLIENIYVNASNSKEAATQISEQTADALLRLLAMASTTAG